VNCGFACVCVIVCLFVYIFCLRDEYTCLWWKHDFQQLRKSSHVVGRVDRPAANSKSVSFNWSVLDTLKIRVWERSCCWFYHVVVSMSRVVHGLGWPMGLVGLGWVEIFQFLVGWVGSTIAKVLKIWKDYFNAFKARLDKIWLHQAVKFDFVADLTGTGNRLEGVIKW